VATYIYSDANWYKKHRGEIKINFEFLTIVRHRTIWGGNCYVTTDFLRIS
jgi:hypothetical protein